MAGRGPDGGGPAGGREAPAQAPEGSSGHFAGDNPACQETDWDGRRPRALLTAQADDRNDIIKYTQCDKECYLRAKRQIGTEGALERY